MLASPFGPRLTALVGLMSGVYYMGRRRAQVFFLEKVLDVAMLLGAVSAPEGRSSAALQKPHEDVRAAMDADPVKHADATSWPQAGRPISLWGLATDVAAPFRIVDDETAEIVYPLFGPCSGILISDRATVFLVWDPTHH